MFPVEDQPRGGANPCFARAVKSAADLQILGDLISGAVENAGAAVSGRGLIWIGVSEIGGADKLTLRFRGPGLGESALRRLQTVDSRWARDLPAALSFNPFGICVRSCAAGSVAEIVLGRFDENNGPLPRRTYAGVRRETIDVTPFYDSEALAEDWTELLFFGSSAEQDTASEPFAGDSAEAPHWLPHLLHNRFFRLPDQVEILLDAGLHPLAGTQRFIPMARRLKDYARTETVDTPDGLAIHYFFDPPHPRLPKDNLSAEGALQTSSGMVGLVFRDELYQLRMGLDWIAEAPNFGFSRLARHVTVLVELPASSSLTPDLRRRALLQGEAEESVLSLDLLARDIRVHRPAWLRDVVEKGARTDDLVSAPAAPAKGFRVRKAPDASTA